MNTKYLYAYITLLALLQTLLIVFGLQQVRLDNRQMLNAQKMTRDTVQLVAQGCRSKRY